MSTISVRTPRALAAARASKSTAEGSAPSLCRTTGDSSRSAQVWSCSMAPARNVSAAASRTLPAGRLLAGGELGGRRRLARAVDAHEKGHEERHVGAAAAARGADARSFSISASSIARSARGPSAPRRSARSRTASVRAAAVSAPTSGREQGLLERLEHRLVDAEALLHGVPSFSRISVCVMKRPRRTFAKKPPRATRFWAALRRIAARRPWGGKISSGVDGARGCRSRPCRTTVFLDCSISSRALAPVSPVGSSSIGALEVPPAEVGLLERHQAQAEAQVRLRVRRVELHAAR